MDQLASLPEDKLTSKAAMERLERDLSNSKSGSHPGSMGQIMQPRKVDKRDNSEKKKDKVPECEITGGNLNLIVA